MLLRNLPSIYTFLLLLDFTSADLEYEGDKICCRFLVHTDLESN